MHRNNFKDVYPMDGREGQQERGGGSNIEKGRYDHLRQCPETGRGGVTLVSEAF